MGKITTIDLPDPLDQPHLDEASADDLLAQMAGEAIDRLLRDSDLDVGRVRAELVSEEDRSLGRLLSSQPADALPSTRSTDDAAAAAGATDSNPDPLTLQELDEQAAQEAEAVLAERGVEPASISQATAAATATATVAHDVDAQLARHLDEVLGQLQAVNAAAVAPAAPAAPKHQAASLLRPDDAALLQVTSAVDMLDQIGQLEKQILSTEILQTTNRLLAEEPGADDDDAGQKLPLYLRPLEWLNLPLLRCGDDTRDALGKVAIVTLINALAVLLYVLLFRR